MLTEAELALLDLSSDDWYSLQELTREFAIGQRPDTEMRGPTEETLRSLYAKGLIRIAWVKHHYLRVRAHGPRQRPEERDIPIDGLDDVFANPKIWEGQSIHDWKVEFTISEEGERARHEAWRQRAGDSG